VSLLPLVAMAGAGMVLALGAGLVRPTPQDVLLGLGPAYLLGTAATAIIAIAALVLGFSLVPAFVAGILLTVASGGLLLRRRPTPPVGSGAVGVVAWVVLAAIAALGVGGAIVALGEPLAQWDAWSIWGRKAVELSGAGRLDPAFFSHPAYVAMHPDYPLLVPVLEAVRMKAGASADGTGAAIVSWSLFVAYAWTVVFVAVRVLGSLRAALAGVVLLLVPGGYWQALSGYADLPVGIFLGSGTLLLGCWLRTGAPVFAGCGGLLLAAAACTKNEGLFAAILVLGAALLVAHAYLPAPRRHVVAALALTLAAVLPWRLWLARHGLHGDLPLVQGLDPSYLAGRAGRAPLAVRVLWRDLTGPDWPLIVPVALVLIALGWRGKETQPLAQFHLLALSAFFAALVWIYWISASDIHWHLGTSAARTVTGLAFLAVSAVVHLSGGSGRARAVTSGAAEEAPLRPPRAVGRSASRA
jgi:hypothetical protein